MSTTSKVAIGVAGLAIVYFVLRARAQAQQNAYTTSSTPAPAPMGYGDGRPPAAPPPIYSTGPTSQARSGRGAF
jgi:hypothetical protein